MKAAVVALHHLPQRAPRLRADPRGELQARAGGKTGTTSQRIPAATTSGPIPLGSDTSTSPLAWQTHDLEQMLLASRELGVPMIIGSSGDTGSNSRVDLYVKIIRELAAKHRLSAFRLGYFYSEVDKDAAAAHARRRRCSGSRPAIACRSELDATERIVAMAGVHPFIELLKQGADVIIGGAAAIAACSPRRRSTTASRDQSYYLGKVLECASFCAEPTAARRPCSARSRATT
jgi:hypothetical protein